MFIRKIAAGLLAAGLFLCGGVTASASPLPSGVEPDKTGASVEAFVQAHAETTAGMAVSVFDAEQTLYTGCFGFADREASLATDESTVFEWGSVTKLLVWTSVMQLVEQGKLDLDTDIRTYLPDGFLHNLRYDEPVTMLHLMNHNAGFQESLTDVAVRSEADLRPLDELLSVRQPEQVSPPGRVTAYSNWGVALAGYIVERVAGQPLYEYVGAHIFEPLGMRQTSLKPDYRDNSFVRSQWDRLAFYDVSGRRMDSGRAHIALYPAGSCASTVGDFRRFAQALLSPEGGLFEKPETYTLFLSPSSAYPQSGLPRVCHGLWMIPFGSPVYGHGGNTLGCSSYLLLSPSDGIGMVVMTNQADELIYNTEMPALVFGTFSEKTWFPQGRTLPQGFFRPSRTVYKGGFKIYSLSAFDFGEADTKEFWEYDPEEGVVRTVYTDAVRVPTVRVVGEYALVGFWALTVAAAVVLLVIQIVRRLRKKTVRPLGALAAVCLVLQLAAPGLLAFVALNALDCAPSSVYIWGFTAYAVLLAVFAGLAVSETAGLCRRWRDLKRRTRVFQLMTLAGNVTAIANILYWNLCMFWI